MAPLVTMFLLVVVLGWMFRPKYSKRELTPFDQGRRSGAQFQVPFAFPVGLQSISADLALYYLLVAQLIMLTWTQFNSFIERELLKLFGSDSYLISWLIYYIIRVGLLLIMMYIIFHQGSLKGRNGMLLITILLLLFTIGQFIFNLYSL